MIKCSSSEGCKAEAKKVGYYLDAGYEVENTETTTDALSITATQLIKCTDTEDTCVTLGHTTTESLTEGYYVDASTIQENETTSGGSRKRSINSRQNDTGTTNTTTTATIFQKLIYCVAQKSGEGNDATVTGYTCTQVNPKIGYYLDANDQLIKCTSEKCEIITTDKIETAFYLNSHTLSDQDNNYYGLISCKKEQSSKPCILYTTNFNAGYYVNGDSAKPKETNGVIAAVTFDTLINCIKNDDNSLACNEVKSPKDNYYDDASVATYSEVNGVTVITYPQLINCNTSNTDGKCIIIETLITKSYYLNAVATDLKEALFKCDGDSTVTCTMAKEQSVKEGIYVNGEDNHLIKCDDEKCSSKKLTNEADNGKTIYYIDAGSNANIIKCPRDDSQDGFSCKTQGHGAISNTLTHYLSEAGRAITCETTDTGCWLEDAKIKGYFTNKGSTTDIVLSCDGGGCIEVGSSLTDTGVGTLGVSGNSISITIGSANTDVSSIPANQDTYKMIQVEESKFPGVNTAGIISIKIGKDGSAIYLEDGGLPSCSNTSEGNVCFADATNGQYCVDQATKKIYQTIITKTVDETNNPIITNNCVIIERTDTELTDSSEEIFYFDIDGKPVTLPTSDTLPITIPNIFAYVCTFDNTGGNEGCIFAKGYVDISDNKAVQCSGWRREGCTITTIDPTNTTGACAESNKEGGLLINGKSICFGTDGSNTLPTANAVNPHYAVFQVSRTPGEPNPIYGMDEEGMVYLKLTSTSVLYTDDFKARTNGFHRNAAVIDDLEKALVHCKGNTNDDSNNNAIECEIRDAFNGYYLNAGSDAADNPVIKCETDTSNGIAKSCKTEAVTATVCSVVGSLIKENTNTAEMKISLCKTDKTPQEINTESSIYITLELDGANSRFPLADSAHNGRKREDPPASDGTASTITKLPVKVVGDGSVRLLEENSLPECGSNPSDTTTACATDATDGQVCITAEGVLYQTTVSDSGVASCGAVTLTEDIKYFNDEAVIITDSFVNKATMAYQCTTSKCTLIHGYSSIVDNKGIYCSGWKGEVCGETDNSYSNYNGGYNGQGLSFPSDVVITLPGISETLPSRVAFISSNTSEIYGTMEGDIVLLALTDKTAVVSEFAEGGKFLFDL